MRILLAVDSEALKKAIFIAFAPYAVFLVKASSLSEATELGRRDQFDAIIADLDLKDAYAAKDYLSLQQKNPHAPVILLQGSYTSIDPAACLELGLKYILKKPFDAFKLIQMFETQLHLPLASIPSSQRQEPEGLNSRTGALTHQLPHTSNPVPLMIGQQVDLEKLIEKEVKRILPEMLEDYCRTHFEQVASKVIQLEIEKLDHSRRFDGPSL